MDFEYFQNAKLHPPRQTPKSACHFEVLHSRSTLTRTVTDCRLLPKALLLICLCCCDIYPATRRQLFSSVDELVNGRVCLQQLLILIPNILACIFTHYFALSFALKPCLVRGNPSSPTHLQGVLDGFILILGYGSDLWIRSQFRSKFGKASRCSKALINYPQWVPT